MERVLLDGLSDDVASLLGPLAAARAITIEQISPDGPLAAHADERRLRQVMVNLVSNAVKYNCHGGLITICCRLGAADEVEVSITDTGPGLTPAEIERVFVPFERLEAEQHGIEGTGIGLPLALSLTHAMHGLLDVASVPGAGTTFTIRLPRAELDSFDVDDAVLRAVGGDRDLELTGPSAALAVVSIEDNPASALLLTRLFKAWPNATLYSARSGREGIALVLEHRPDVVLLDLHLPDLPGEEVFARLQAETATAGIPVIALSADATPPTVRRVLARGITGYVTKPVDLRQLHNLINDTVARRRQGGTPRRLSVTVPDHADRVLSPEIECF
jgi:CheY-like chemotaxis protein/anti-sigma regulatory factor (Ser/Thr protein kinase)